MDSKEFENTIWEMIQPMDGENGQQLPRPWFTAFEDPQKARVFVVGANQKNGYDPSEINVMRHFNGLFSREGETCRGIYEEAGGRSKTRAQIDNLITRKLSNCGVNDGLETNLVCRSSRQFSDLDATERDQGLDIFSFLIKTISPEIVILFGKGVIKGFARWVTRSTADSDYRGLSERLIHALPDEDSEPRFIHVNGAAVFCIRGLVHAGWTEWNPWAHAYTDRLADAVCETLK